MYVCRGMGGGMPGQAGMPAGGTADDLGKGSSFDLQLKLNT